MAPSKKTAFCTGDGSGKPLGIVHASSPYAVVTAATGSSTSYKLADLKTVYKALPAAYRLNATWLMNADDFAELAALADPPAASSCPSLQFDPPSLFGCSPMRPASSPTAPPRGTPVGGSARSGFASRSPWRARAR